MSGVAVPDAPGYWVFAELRSACTWARARFDERALALCAMLLAVLLLHAATAAVRRWRRDASNATAGSDVLAKLRARTERRHAEAAAADPAVAAAAAAAVTAARKARRLKLLLILGAAGSVLTLASPVHDSGPLGGARRLAANSHLHRLLDGAVWARGFEGARRHSTLVEGVVHGCHALLGWPPPLTGVAEGREGGGAAAAEEDEGAEPGLSPLAATDHYEALGLTAAGAPNAAAVRRAYRRRALFYHPDKSKQEAQRRHSAASAGGSAAPTVEQEEQRRAMQAEFLRLTEVGERWRQEVTHSLDVGLLFYGSLARD